jgi:hypothetical protein
LSHRLRVLFLRTRAAFGTAEDAGATVDDIRGTLAAVAPIVGSARVVSAAGKTIRALGLAEAIEESE